jgi:four helix bundle protein
MQISLEPASARRGATRVRERCGTKEVPMLKIYDVSVDVVKRLVPVVAEIDRHDGDLAKQLKRARSSIPLNISEGSRARRGRRNLHYGYAKGSAQECIAILETAVASQYIKRPPEEVVPMLRQIIGTLYNCIGGHR